MLNWQDLPWGFVINKIKIKLKIQSFHLNLVKSNDGKFGFGMIQRRNTKLLFSETCSNSVVIPLSVSPLATGTRVTNHFP